MNQTEETTILEPEIDDTTTVGLPFVVVLYNDDYHTFEEVIYQLQKATNCSFETAREYAFTVHVKGQATVYKGELGKCLQVSSVLEEISLHTQVVS